MGLLPALHSFVSPSWRKSSIGLWRPLAINRINVIQNRKVNFIQRAQFDQNRTGTV